ncbi:FUSC family protein [Dyella sp.]|uniref:FUSC family protein n=1 Tax=Dyella sp. TaxID=1869338 RepID=UPI002ED51300
MAIGTPSRWLRGMVRRRPGWMVAFAIEEANLSEGMRAACASTAMLVLGMYLGRPEFSWAAIGAFWACLADASGSMRARWGAMLSFSVLSTVWGGITAYAAGIGTWAAAAAIFAFAAMAGLARIWGMAAYQVAVLAATACVVMVDKPLYRMGDGVTFLGIYLGGCLFAMALSLSVWRISRFAPVRYALRLTYARLAELARDNARLIDSHVTDEQAWAAHAAELRAQVRESIEAARHALQATPQRSVESGRVVHDNLLLALADAERIFASLIAVAHVEEGGRPEAFRHARVARCLAAIARVLKRMGEQLGTRSAPYPVGLRGRLRTLSTYLDAGFGRSLSLRLWSEDLPHLATYKDEAWPAVLGDVLRRAWGTLRHHVSARSVLLSYAIRLGLVTMAAFVVVRLLHVQYGYWATMAVLLILQPSFATTWPRGVERAVGSILGALLAVAIGNLAHTPLAISLAVFVTIGLTMLLRPVSYSLFVIFLTPSFVLVADYAAPADGYTYALARLGNNILGCVIALAATWLLWPRRKAQDLQPAIVDAVQANLGFLAAALADDGTGDAACEEARRRAGLTSNQAEHYHWVMRMEGAQHRSGMSHVGDVLALLRRIAGTATQIRARTEVLPHARDLAAWVSAMSEDLVGHMRSRSDIAHSARPYPRDEVDALEKATLRQVRRLSQLLNVDTAHLVDGPVSQP